MICYSRAGDAAAGPCSSPPASPPPALLFSGGWLMANRKCAERRVSSSTRNPG